MPANIVTALVIKCLLTITHAQQKPDKENYKQAALDVETRSHRENQGSKQHKEHYREKSKHEPAAIDDRRKAAQAAAIPQRHSDMEVRNFLAKVLHYFSLVEHKSPIPAAIARITFNREFNAVDDKFYNAVIWMDVQVKVTCKACGNIHVNGKNLP